MGVLTQPRLASDDAATEALVQELGASEPPDLEAAAAVLNQKLASLSRRCLTRSMSFDR